MYSISKNVTNEENKLYFTLSENVNENKVINIKKWNLEIPKIDLNAEIVEGVSSDVLNLNIGHFEGTGLVDKNICLAAHNRGYTKNYFEHLDKLNKGDEIIYFFENKEYKFEVSENFIIEDTNLEVLEYRGKNEMTLITCVKNRENLRRCVKAIRIEE